MKEELYQNHGDHIEAIMPPKDFMENYLQLAISESTVLNKVRSEVTMEELDHQRTDVTSLKYGDNSLSVLTLVAYSSQSDSNLFVSLYPIAKGENIRAKIVRILEWDNEIEATIICCVGDFEFAFFATDYYCNKKAYCVGDTMTFELSAIGNKVEEAQRGFSFEGQQAVDWLAKIGKQPTYDEQGKIESVKFSTENLVAYLNHDRKCPDEGEFQSPITDIEATSIFNIPFYSGHIYIHRDDDFGDISVPLYFRKGLMPKVLNGDPIRGWLWLIGKLAVIADENSDNHSFMTSHHRHASTNELSNLGLKFVDAIDNFNFKCFDDIMPIMSILDQIVVESGYVVDAFREGDRHGSVMQLYTCKKDSIIKYIPFEREVPVLKTRRNIFGVKEEYQDGTKLEFEPYSDEMYVTGELCWEIAKAIPPVFNHLTIPFNEVGIWQAFLLQIAPHMMPTFWHGGYSSREYLFNLDDLKNKEVDCSKYYQDESLPRVDIIGENTARITCTYWNDWRGLCRETVQVNRNMEFENIQVDVLVEYKCDIIF